jgi:hypothetical protein
MMATKSPEDIAHSRLSQPSRLAFALLVERLTRASEQSRTSGILVPSAATAIRSILDFMTLDPQVAPTGALAILVDLLAAIHDLEQGAKPPSLFEYRPADQRTKPTELYQDYVRGHLAAALDLLVRRGGMKAAPAADWLVSELKIRGVRDRAGHPITGRQIKRWRSEAAAHTGPKAAQETFEELGKRHRDPILGRFDTIEGVESRVRAIVANLATFGFRHSPPESRERG